MKKIISFILIFVLSLITLTSCGKTAGVSSPDSISPNGSQTTEPSESATDSEGSTAEKTDSEKTDIPSDLTEKVNTLSISCSEGTDNCWTFLDQTLTFSSLTANTTCSISGEFDGQIVVDGGDDYKFELELNGVKLYSDDENPISVLSGDKVTLTAKKGTVNYIYDTRSAVSSNDETSVSSAVYSKSDLSIGGKGELIVISSENNGIHTKKDLTVKNLTLSVTSADNALKGNDSVTIESGNITLIAKSGDGIKTTNSDVSSKGKQRGTVSVSGGSINIYAACDGIDAAYNAEITSETSLTIYTDRYSPYTKEISEAESSRYIRFTSGAYNYSVKYYNDDNDFKWINAEHYKTVNGGRESYYYYSFEKLDGYKNIQIFAYASGEEQGQDENYVFKTDYISWNESYDTFAIESRRGSFTYNWTNYSSSAGGQGNPWGGMGGMNDGNSEKGDHSTKGIKADNEITISGGEVTINSYDDSIHANADTALENGETAAGNVTISGGTLVLFSKDDGVHADGTLTVSGGKIDITGSYEGLEGTFVVINDGDISIVSRDDGVNATTTSGTGITFNGGKVYVYAGGDGVDSNSRTSYQGISFAGGEIIIISTSGGNSSIDTEQGYSYSGGTVLAVCPANGMGNESLNCRNFSSVGTKTNMNLKKSSTLSVIVGNEVVSSVEMPCALSSLVIFLGSSSATFSAT